MITTVERNKETLRRFHDAVSTGDEEIISRTIDEVVQPDVQIRTPLPIETTGTSALKEVFTVLRRAFPDLHIEIEDVIAEGDRVVTRNTVTGTHRGEYMGVPPTGRTITYKEILIARFTDGRVAETWAVVDVMSQLRQLGVLPGPNAGGA
ncbi:ester cyclase [Nonomuraea mesophila]|uniref:Ester cyclase n=1 Tax=Nonomuraea mesophila TaxID=2530382 RepID=A0A4R5FDT1_9ACTN|nr:ester cyclase [Nonomuraea mesophila]